MKNLKKLFLIGLILLFVGAGCVPVIVIPENPTPLPGGGSSQTVANTIYIVSSDGVHGDVYIDNTYVGTLNPYGTLDMYNISFGIHTLTLNTLPYTTFTINVVYDGQTFNIDWSGNVM